MKLVKSFGRLGLLLILVVIIFSVLASSLYTVNEGEFVYITQFGAIQSIELDAGLKAKIPFIQDVNRLTKKQMIDRWETSLTTGV